MKFHPSCADIFELIPTHQLAGHPSLFEEKGKILAIILKFTIFALLMSLKKNFVPC
jgi:hypothetical protein